MCVRGWGAQHNVFGRQGCYSNVDVREQRCVGSLLLLRGFCRTRLTQQASRGPAISPALHLPFHKLCFRQPSPPIVKCLLLYFLKRRGGKPKTLATYLGPTPSSLFPLGNVNRGDERKSSVLEEG